MATRPVEVEAGAVDQHPEMQDLRKRSQMRDIWHRLCRNRLAMFGMIIVLILILAAVFAPLVVPYDYAAQDLTNMKAWPIPWVRTIMAGIF